MSNADIKAMIEAYAVAIRAGSITAQQVDEEFFRTLAGFPQMTEEVQTVWKDEGVRRPITLKSTEERQADLSGIQNKIKK